MEENAILWNWVDAIQAEPAAELVDDAQVHTQAEFPPLVLDLGPPSASVRHVFPLLLWDLFYVVVHFFMFGSC